MDITGAWKRQSVERLRKVTPAKLFPSRRSSASQSSECLSHGKQNIVFRGTSRKHHFAHKLLKKQRREKKKLHCHRKLLLQQTVVESCQICPVSDCVELKREIALSQLLQLIELPVVEGIVGESGSCVKNDGTGFNNFAFKQQDSILSAESPGRYHILRHLPLQNSCRSAQVVCVWLFCLLCPWDSHTEVTANLFKNVTFSLIPLPAHWWLKATLLSHGNLVDTVELSDKQFLIFSRREDEWMDVAVDLLNCLANGVNLFDASQSEDTVVTQKLRLYQSIVDHYVRLDEARWPDVYADLHLELYSQLMQGRR